ncbi:MAG: hypothetical protein GWN07_01355 [Actinobacteria bacterium]|nr:hypothetical protein [Actinomycetota bacterium]NIU64182.1 hypothetical protein [Actinomycetota bacterium]NIW25984.1 hypothetical protein [Actinomycetota bacterium]NIX18560.1 hypothetical protein [Actinomycetota bacterium]
MTTNEATTLASIREYLPATLGPSNLLAAIEYRLKAPFRRTYDVWLPADE